ncbi:MAG: glycerol-3-phosphate 1-O-acyltransferase PlsY [Motiliproteus sp.]
MTIESSIPALLTLLIAYLLGSVSSAVVVCQFLGLKDPRTLGSNNPGATNVWRTGSRLAGMTTLVADILKGALPVWLAQQLKLDNHIVALCGLCAMLGHLYPLYFRFRGGKGVATFLGACLALLPILALCQIGIWLLLAGLFRLSSQASLATAVATPILCWWLTPTYLPVLSLMSLLLIVRHRDNIRKLLQGNESRL